MSLKGKIGKIKQIKSSYTKQKYLEKIYRETGADFMGHIDKSTLNNSSIHGLSYEASMDIPEVLSNLKVTPNDSLIDIGCGKGYALHLFSILDFGKITGIEYHETLCNTAKNNMKLLHPDDNRINIIQGDALLYNYDSYNYLYLFNPLNQIGMTKLYEIIKASLIQKPRNLFIIYQTPVYANIFTQDKLFRLVVIADGCAILKHDNI